MPMPEAKENHSVCAIDGLIYVMGGRSYDKLAMASVHRFDPVANLWRAVAPMLTARFTFTSCVLGGSIRVAGGHNGSRNMDSVEQYSVISDSWSPVTPMGQARGRFGAHAMRLELDLFDSLMLKAKRGQR